MTQCDESTGIHSRRSPRLSLSHRLASGSQPRVPVEADRPLPEVHHGFSLSEARARGSPFKGGNARNSPMDVRHLDRD